MTKRAYYTLFRSKGHKNQAGYLCQHWNGLKWVEYDGGPCTPITNPVEIIEKEDVYYYTELRGDSNSWHYWFNDIDKLVTSPCPLQKGEKC